MALCKGEILYQVKNVARRVCNEEEYTDYLLFCLFIHCEYCFCYHYVVRLIFVAVSQMILACKV